MDYGLTASGFIIRGYDDIRNEIISDYKNIWSNIRDDSSNPLITQADYLSTWFYNQEQIKLVEYNNLQLSTATEQFLDNIGSNDGIFREVSKNTTGTVKVTAKKGTIIPIFWGVETENGKFYQTTNANGYTFSTDSTEDFEVIAINGVTDGSSGNIGVGEISKQSQVVQGVTKVTNEFNFINGRDIETDTEYRKRIYTHKNSTKNFGTTSIENFIKDNTNSQKVKVFENFGDTTDANGLPPHSYSPIVIGGTNAEILDAVWNKNLAGIRSFGDINRADQFGNEKGFFRGVSVDIHVKISITSDDWSTDVTNRYKENIMSSITNYINSIDISGVLEVWELVGLVYRAASGIKNIDVKIGRTAATLSGNDIQLKFKEIAVSDTGLFDIEVN